MKTNSRSFRDPKKTSNMKLATARLSDNGFYLIVLASLLNKWMEPGMLKKFATPVSGKNDPLL